MQLQHWFLIVFFSAPIFSYADTCPRIIGTFECQSKYEIQIQNELRDGLTNYIVTDPQQRLTFVPDGSFHEMTFGDGRKGRYRATCRANAKHDALIVEVHTPDGGKAVDQYYIENKGLVRIRFEQGRAKSMSCRPTRGTWRLY